MGISVSSSSVSSKNSQAKSGSFLLRRRSANAVLTPSNTRVSRSDISSVADSSRRSHQRLWPPAVHMHAGRWVVLAKNR
eukprot:448005-Rhodomonas_salina.2